MNGPGSRRTIVAWLVAAVSVVSAASGLHAEQHPNLARGFSPGEAFDFGAPDAVNLFNGGLNINIPIGPRYAIGDGLSYGLHLSYASNTWEPEALHLPQIRMHPRRSSNTGHGWMLSLAGTLYRRPGISPQGGTGFELESPDGSEHVFYGNLHQGESDPCFFTRDNTYLRLCTAPPRTLPGGEVLERHTIESPDGTIQTYEEIQVAHRLSDWDDERFRLVGIEDRLGNWVAVHYTRSGSTMTWTIVDRVGRTHTVKLSLETVDAVDRWRVDRANLQKFGGGTAQYDFVYEPVTIDRSCKSSETTPGPLSFVVPLLRAVVLPAAAGSYRMPGYNLECTPNLPESPLGDLPGTLTGLDLPTGGRLQWTYRDHVFLVTNPQDPVQRVAERSTGVDTKKTLNATGGCDHGATPADHGPCTWSYSSFSYSDHTRRMQVVNPVGDRTVHWFRQRRRVASEGLYVGWDYGLPFSTETEHTHQGLFLSHQVYQTSGSNQVLKREAYVFYEHDQLIPILLAEESWRNSNRRVLVERTLYHDDKESGVPRFTETRFEDFDGLGRHRRVIRSGDLTTAGSPDAHTTTTAYNPARGTYHIDPATNAPSGQHDYVPFPAGSPWVLNTYTSVRAEQTGSTVVAQTCFEPSTGRLKRRRLLAGTVPGANDVVVEYTRVRTTVDPGPNGKPGIVSQELTYGGQGQTMGAGNLCTLGLPANPVYRTRYSEIYGALARTEPLKPGGATMNLRTLDLAIDQWTGLAVSSTDPAGLTTNYLYDALGRLTWFRPVTGGDAWTEIVYNAASGSTPAKVFLNRRPNNQPSGTPLEESRFIYDPFGRLRRDERKVAGHGWTAVETGTNALGWKTFVTERGRSPGSLPHKTWFTQHDAFGRPGRILLPDYDPVTEPRHFVKLSYNGIRLVTREVSIASNLAGGETRSSTTELSNHLGQLWRVQEPSGPAGASRNSTYGYDAAGRLAWVRQADTGGFVQPRDFIYDGRGFLTAERHPETGWTTYFDHDARGHADRKRTGPGGSLFDLGFTYDAAERLTEVREFGSGRVLKSFTYGSGTSAADRSNNRIKTAVRHNHVVHPDTGNPISVTVSETYTYGGTGGRPSLRTTALTPTGQGFTQGWSYDQLGNVSSLTYPTCTHTTATCGTAAGKRPRTVGFTRQFGYLTAVPGWAGSISHHANGMLNQVAHANGVTYRQGLDPHWMRRPGSLDVTHPNQLISLVEGENGPLAVPLAYAYDGAGNVKSWYDWRYRYDPVSRILEGGIIGGGPSQAYTYDVFGNILSITTNRGAGPQTVALGVDRTTNRLSASLYDLAGNLTNRGGFSYGYDALSMMTKMTGGGANNVYLYTADDERIWTVDASVGPWNETFTLRDLGGKALRTFTTTTGFEALAWSQDYVHRDGQLLATARVNGGGETRHHFHLDHLGTPLLITNPQGGTEALHSYFPFGEEIYPGGDTERMKFTGHERDLGRPGQADDLDYMHARYCSPMLGRFLSVDPVVQLDRAAARPQLWNRYSYALNNPLAFVDPTGRIVNLASMTAEDRQTLIAQLSEKTGLRLTYDEKAGNLVVLGIISDDSGKATGSKIARRDLLTAIGSDKTVYGLSRNGSDTINLGRRVGPHLYLDFDDIALIETGRNDPGTFDAGMIFLHELKHHQGLRDPSEAMLRRRPTLQGQTVAHMNKIRRELGLPLRAQYATDQDSDGRDFLPFTNGPIYVPTGIAQ